MATRAYGEDVQCGGQRGGRRRRRRLGEESLHDRELVVEEDLRVVSGLIGW